MTRAPDSLGWGIGGALDPTAHTREVERTLIGPESHFVFRFAPHAGWVFPAGHIDSVILGPVEVYVRHAVGGIVLLDDDQVEVRFASYAADGRRHARRRLEEWANMLGVRPTYLPGRLRLRPRPGTHRAWTCTRCGRHADGTGERGMAYQPQQRWRDTRCECGGHLLPQRTAPRPSRRRPGGSPP